jgi:hypothetical protein
MKQIRATIVVTTEMPVSDDTDLLRMLAMVQADPWEVRSQGSYLERSRRFRRQP